MSITAIAWAKSQRTGSPTMKAVLMAIADYADEAGRAWPSQARLIEDTELSERAVRNALIDLASTGLIRREERRRSDGSRSTDILYLNIAAPANRHQMPPPRHEVPEQPARDAPPPAPDAGLELPTNYHLNHQKSSEAKASGAVAPNSEIGDDPSEEERELYKRGKKVLGRTAGGVITDLLKAKGRNVALARAEIERASQAENAMEFIQGVIRGDKRTAPLKSLFPVINGHDDFNPEALKAARRQREQAAAGRIQ